MRTTRFALIIAAFFALSAFSTQPLDERKAQDALPKSQHPMWHTLGKTKIIVDQKEGYYSAVFPPEIKLLEGTQVTVSGFILPLESNEKFKHFLLSKRTPTCPFCPPGEPNEIIDVWLANPISYSENIITVKGTFELMNDREMGLFFKLKNAQVK
jgi:uncharacterized protein